MSNKKLHLMLAFVLVIAIMLTGCGKMSTEECVTGIADFVAVSSDLVTKVTEELGTLELNSEDELKGFFVKVYMNQEILEKLQGFKEEAMAIDTSKNYPDEVKEQMLNCKSAIIHYIANYYNCFSKFVKGVDDNDEELVKEALEYYIDSDEIMEKIVKSTQRLVELIEEQ